MEIKRLYLYLKLFLGFLAVLIGEYLCCGMYFRLMRGSDFVQTDWICGVTSVILCYLIFRKLIKAALKERVPILVIVFFALFMTALLGFFLRYSLQLANGMLDFSSPENRIISVVSKKISPFGGRIKDGVNPLAYMIYFHDWDNPDETCELLTTHDFFYSVDDGSTVEIAVRKGLFHWAWVEYYQVVTPPRLNPASKTPPAYNPL